MVNYPVAFNVKALSLFFQCDRSYKRFSTEWQQHMISYELPSRRYINRLVQRFESTGSVSKRSPPGRPKTQRVLESINFVAEHFTLNPSDSPYNFAKFYESYSESTVRRILKLDIGWRPYRPKLIHKLEKKDFEMRYWFCSEMISRLKIDPDLLSNMIFFDEVFIKLNGHVCTFNLRFWSDQQPNMTVEKKSNARGLMVLVGVSVRGSILCFFDTVDIPSMYAKKDKQKRRQNIYGSMPVNSQTFLYLLKNNIVSELSHFFPDINLADVIPVFDGASIHRERNVVEFLNETFHQWIGNNSKDLKWPSHSPGNLRLLTRLLSYI